MQVNDGSNVLEIFDLMKFLLVFNQNVYNIITQDMEAALAYLRSTFFATPTLSTVSAYLIYYAYICLASILVPSRKVNGHPQPKRGPQLTYTINGFRLTILTIVLIILFGGVLPELKAIQFFSVANLAK